ncbi:MAG: hypothetical protein ACSHXK_17030 [Oceanococcus sp.]
MSQTVAIVYDFDGTLSPLPMQEYTILPELGVQALEFWDGVNVQSRGEEAEPMLVYMRRLLEVAQENGQAIRRESFLGLGSRIELFPGVLEWFDFIDQRVLELSDGKVELVHYIVSAGLQEILDGVPIRDKFRRIYASSYHYDSSGHATFPRVLVTDTSKTQFLFRINKGKEDLRENINTHMPQDERPVPFSQMLYIGDGETDVPSMAVTRQNGGFAIAVHAEGSEKGEATCKSLLEAGRVNFYAPADYRETSRLAALVDTVMRAIISNMNVKTA